MHWLGPDSHLFSIMSKIVDTLVLNTVWLLVCVPLPLLSIVLVGRTENMWLFVLTMVAMIPVVPATTALYYAMVKSIRRERNYAVKEFFRSFVRNFKQGSILAVIAMVVITILYIDFQYTWNLLLAQETWGNVYLGIFIIISLMFIGMYVYVCPVLSRFDMKVSYLLKITFVMGARHLLTTIGLFVLAVGTLLGCYLLLPSIFFLPAVATLLASFLIEPVFKRYMPEKEEVKVDEFGDETGQTKDEWYLD